VAQRKGLCPEHDLVPRLEREIALGRGEAEALGEAEGEGKYDVGSQAV
jgi:hypothetical protein